MCFPQKQNYFGWILFIAEPSWAGNRKTFSFTVDNVKGKVNGRANDIVVFQAVKYGLKSIFLIFAFRVMERCKKNATVKGKWHRQKNWDGKDISNLKVFKHNKKEVQHNKSQSIITHDILWNLKNKSRNLSLHRERKGQKSPAEIFFSGIVN